MPDFVLKIGGSVLASPINLQLITEYSKVLKKLASEGFKVLVVTGGGELARRLIEYARSMEMPVDSQDRVAIQASRVVAQLLAESLKPVAPSEIPLKIARLPRLFDRFRVVVMGGLRPGMTTDTVAVLAALKLGFPLFVKATDKDGIYDKDPSIYPDASMIDSMSFDRLMDMFGKIRYKAGLKSIIDPKAARMIARHRLKTVVLNGFKPENVELAVKGHKIGTVVCG